MKKDLTDLKREAWLSDLVQAVFSRQKTADQDWGCVGWTPEPDWHFLCGGGRLEDFGEATSISLLEVTEVVVGVDEIHPKMLNIVRIKIWGRDSTFKY